MKTCENQVGRLIRLIRRVKNIATRIIVFPYLVLMRNKYRIWKMEDYYRERARMDRIEEKLSEITNSKKAKEIRYMISKRMRVIASLVPAKEWKSDNNTVIMQIQQAIIGGEKDFGDEFRQEISYLKHRGELKVFPYDINEKYEELMNCVEVYNENLLKYVMHNGRKLYFPYDDPERVKKCYTQLIMEQDEKSPHIYFSDKVNFLEGIFVDVGAAEGIISLDVVKKAREVFLIEQSSKWIKPLKKTFRAYGNKVHIVPYLVGSIDTDNMITLDTLLKDYTGQNIFIKLDVEGMEMEVLRGCRKVMKKNHCLFSCAAYHTDSMEKKMVDFFKMMGYKVELSKGYMLFTDGYMTFKMGKHEKTKYPYFRKGIVRAYKEI